MKKPDQRVNPQYKRRDFSVREHSFLVGRNFNRNQTISGVEKEKSTRIEKRKLITQRRKVSSFFMIIFAIVALILIILLQFVATVEIEGENIHNIIPSGKYIYSIEKYYSKQPIERIRSYLKKDDLLTFLQKDHPEIENISQISMSAITKYKFKIKFRRPVASWTSSDKTLYVDKNGISFSYNYYSNPRLSVADESGVQAHSGRTIASSSFLGFIGKIVSEANNRGLVVEKVTIPPASLRQVHIFIKGVSYPVKLLTTASPEGQVVNLDSAIKYFLQNKITPEYLDLRVEGKGYYK